MATALSQTVWIADTQSLDRACDELSRQSVIALDTEFMRETTFHAIPALIQLSDGDKVWLVDPVAVEATPSFKSLLTSPATLKLIHACSEDLEVLMQWAGCVPAPMRDTQVAEGLCSPDPSMGYQRLVEKRLGIVLDKGATRSDWLARPLSSRQQEYAALDVLYLPAIWKEQAAILEHQQRLEWVKEDCDRLIANAQASQDFSQYYKRYRNAWKLSPSSLNVFAELCEWRECQVRERNIPRNWLASDGILFAIAELLPKDKAGLAKISDIRRSVIKRDGATLLDIVAKARKADVIRDALVSPVTPHYKKQLKALKAKVKDVAESLGIAPEVLVTRREYDQWLTATEHGCLTEMTLGGWRGQLLDDGFYNLLTTAS